MFPQYKPAAARGPQTPRQGRSPSACAPDHLGIQSPEHTPEAPFPQASSVGNGIFGGRTRGQKPSPMPPPTLRTRRRRGGRQTCRARTHRASDGRALRLPAFQHIKEGSPEEIEETGHKSFEKCKLHVCKWAFCVAKKCYVLCAMCYVRVLTYSPLSPPVEARRLLQVDMPDARRGAASAASAPFSPRCRPRGCAAARQPPLSLSLWAGPAPLGRGHGQGGDCSFQCSTSRTLERPVSRLLCSFSPASASTSSSPLQRPQGPLGNERFDGGAFLKCMCVCVCAYVRKN